MIIIFTMKHVGGVIKIRIGTCPLKAYVCISVKLTGAGEFVSRGEMKPGLKYNAVHQSRETRSA